MTGYGFISADLTGTEAIFCVLLTMDLLEFRPQRSVPPVESWANG